MAGMPQLLLVTNSPVYRKWIVDSRATNHIVYNKEVLEGIDLRVYLLDRSTVDIACVGRCNLDSAGIVTNVLCIPKIKINLLSVSKLTRDLKCVVTFFLIFVFYRIFPMEW